MYSRKLKSEISLSNSYKPLNITKDKIFCRQETRAP